MGNACIPDLKVHIIISLALAIEPSVDVLRQGTDLAGSKSSNVQIYISVQHRQFFHPAISKPNSAILYLHFYLPFCYFNIGC